jgi:hypothetical protein
MADTAKNQQRYPRPAKQKPGCGFPVLKMLVLFSLNSGSVLNALTASLHKQDLRLLHELRSDLKKGDVLLGDRAYGEYTTLAAWPGRGVDVVARIHAMRKVDFRKARRFARNDGLFVWLKIRSNSPLSYRLQSGRLYLSRSRNASFVLPLLSVVMQPAHYAGDFTAGSRRLPRLTNRRLCARRWQLELCLKIEDDRAWNNTVSIARHGREGTLMASWT